MIVALAGLLGLLIGSFLNVVVWRVPRGESLVRPASACPSCGARVRPHDNVPVVSWLLLRGRCRACKCRISVRYPLVEAGTAVAFTLVAWWSPALALLPALLYLAAITVCLALIDLEHHRLPDGIVLPSYLVTAVLLALATAGTGGGWGLLARSLVGGLAMFLAYFLMAIAYPKGMGFGDVKLAGVLGLYLAWAGWGIFLVGFFAAFLLGGLFSVVLVLGGSAGRKTKVPFGPWMFAGAWLGLILGERAWHAYLTLVGL